MSSTSAGHWSEISNKWALVGAPLRPSAEDIAVFQSAVSSMDDVRGLICGVTPELYRLNWPKSKDVIGVDNNARMIETVWVGGHNQVLLGDWRTLPLTSDSRTIALCDGGFHLVPNPVGQLDFIRSIKRVLAVGGVCAIRLFSLPEQKESVDLVVQDLLAGRVPNLNILKLRLGMAMQSNSTEGVRLGDVWGKVSTLAPSFEQLAQQVGWPVDHLRAIDSYRGSDSRYCFVTPNQVQDMFCKQVGGFRLQSTAYPSYQLGERCPIVVYQRIG